MTTSLPIDQAAEAELKGESGLTGDNRTRLRTVLLGPAAPAVSLGSPRRGRLARRHFVDETSESCGSLLVSAGVNAANRLLRLTPDAPIACDPGSPPEPLHPRPSLHFRTPPTRLAGLLVLLLATPVAHAQNARRVTPLDTGWRFLRGHVTGAEGRGFNDSAWKAVTVPHDWSIEGPYDEKAPSGRGGGYLPSGVSWYRKSFDLPAADKGRRVVVEFDGVMANARVWINGRHLGHRPNGYVSFRYDLTDHLRFGDGDNGRNVIAVRTDTSLQPASRWYTGQGIYREARLVSTDPVHIAPWSLYVTTPEAAAERAVVRVKADVVNEANASRDVALRLTLIAPDGREVVTRGTPSRTIAAHETLTFSEDLNVPSPKRWDLSAPHLYRTVVRVVSADAVLDDESTTFGIRDARFEPATGFWLNGKNFKVLGVNLHHDGGAVGAAVPITVWERRLKNLKQLGVNAIRTAHNPPSPAFLDLADRLGFLVMDEMWDAWTVSKPNANYGVHLIFNEWWEADTRDTVRRDRNHPSIVLYSTGNEIHDTPWPDLAKPILKKLVDVFHANDPSRPVTQGLFRPNISKDYDNGLADMLDVVGQNYRENELIAAYRQKPTRKVIGTENRHERDAWLPVRDNAFYAGQFLWPGIDYLGEEDWPRTTFVRGLLDRTGEPRAAGYQRQSWWSTTPMVRMFRRLAPPPRPEVDPGYDPVAPPPPPPAPILLSDWSPAVSTPHDEDVEVYSNADEVELRLNGRTIGRLPKPTDDAPRIFSKVPFEKGVLTAVARNRGQVVATHELKTAGPAHHIVLKSDRTSVMPSWDEVAHITAEIVDEAGVAVPGGTQEITFTVTGPATVIAADNGDPQSHEPYQSNRRKAFQSRCLALVRATSPAGRVTVSAQAPGLAPGAVSFDAVALSVR
jgi:beta-galactosidase